MMITFHQKSQTMLCVTIFRFRNRRFPNNNFSRKVIISHDDDMITNCLGLMSIIANGFIVVGFRFITSICTLYLLCTLFALFRVRKKYFSQFLTKPAKTPNLKTFSRAFDPSTFDVYANCVERFD